MNLGQTTLKFFLQALFNIGIEKAFGFGSQNKNGRGLQLAFPHSKSLGFGCEVHVNPKPL